LKIKKLKIKNRNLRLFNLNLWEKPAQNTCPPLTLSFFEDKNWFIKKLTFSKVSTVKADFLLPAVNSFFSLSSHLKIFKKSFKVNQDQIYHLKKNKKKGAENPPL